MAASADNRRASLFTLSLAVLLLLAGCAGEAGSRDSITNDSLQDLPKVTAKVATPGRSFRVESFGALADGRTDATAAVQQAIAAAKATGRPAEVVFGAGTYFLACAGPTPTTSQTFCLDVIGARDLTIRGQGAEATQLLLGNPFSGLFWSQDTVGLALRGFAVDYDPLPFTQGTIVAVHPGSQPAFDVRLAEGYPRLDQPMFAPEVTSAGNSFGMIFEPTRPRLKEGTKGYLLGLSYAELSDGSWRVTLMPEDAAELATITPGDRFVLPLRFSTVLAFWYTSQVALQDVTLYAGPGAATLFYYSRGAVTVDGFQVRRRPGTDRLLSTAADALHFANCPAQIAIERCTIEGMGDDALNIYTQGSPITAVQSETTLSVQPATAGYAPGQELQVMDLVSHTVKGVAQIVSFTPGAGSAPATVVLDQPLWGLSPGDTLYSVDLASPGAIISGNTFDSFRGSFRLRSAGAIFSDNTIRDPRNALILIDAEAACVSATACWNEGPSLLAGVSALQLSGNQVPGGELTLVDHRWTPVPVSARGTIDGIFGSGSELEVAGWACLVGLETSVRVDLYVDGPYGSGTYVTSAMANLQREAAVAEACGTATAKHGYSLPLSSATRAAYAGRKIFVHAIDEQGNPLLYNSGSFVVP